MKNIGEILTSKDKSSEILMGNFALVRAFIESNTRVVTSYPGSPTVEIADAIKTIIKDERPFYFEFSTNEKVATEVALGASVNGHLSTVFFKSVGLNVAADCFVQLSLMNLIGGMVIVLGDDPGSHSSQNEQDNRYYALMSNIPILEPSSPNEVYKFYKEAAKLSKKMQMPVILRLTTHVCHAKEKVYFDDWKIEKNDFKSLFSRDNGPYIPLMSDLKYMQLRAKKKLNKVKIELNSSPINKLECNNNSHYGIITSGLSYLSLSDVLLSAAIKPDILKLGATYPVPVDLIRTFLSEHEEVLILEELGDIHEKEIKCIAYDNQIDVKIIGKCTVENYFGEYNYNRVYEIIRETWTGLLPDKDCVKTETTYVAERLPQMCPGCGHRSAFYAIKQALSEGDISVGDIGCHSLGNLKPYFMGEILVCMGASLGVGSGMSLFNKERKIVMFLGDSTFFHAGIPGIINALYNKHNVTLILLPNGTTAMTGHQEHPGTGRNFSEVTEAMSIKNILESLGVKDITEVDTYMQNKLKDTVTKAINTEGFSVVIAKHPCMLKLTRENRKKDGYVRKNVRIMDDQCQNIYKCINEFACPSFSRDVNDNISVNKDLCIGDGSCIQTCPHKAVKFDK